MIEQAIIDWAIETLIRLWLECVRRGWLVAAGVFIGAATELQVHAMKRGY